MTDDGARPGADPRARLVAVDLARLVALVGMMGAHTMLWTLPPAWLVALVDGPPSTLFAVLGGASVVLAARSRLAVGDVGGAIRETATRGALVAVVGALLGPLAPAVFVVLMPFGAAIALGGLLVAAPSWVLAAVAVPLAVGGGWAAAWGRAQWAWLGDSVGAATLVRDPLGSLRDIVLTGAYPAVTWLAYLLVGMLLARAWLAARAKGRERRMLGVAGGIGALLVALGMGMTELGLRLIPSAAGDVDLARDVLVVNGYGAPASTDPVWLLLAAPHTGTPADVARTVGAALLVVAALGLLVSLLPARGVRLLEPLRAAGAAPLTVYVVHVTLLSALQVLGAPAELVVGEPAWALHAGVALVIGAVLAVRGRPAWLEALVSRFARVAGGPELAGEPMPLERIDDLGLAYEVRLDAPREAVWAALTEPDAVVRWLPDRSMPIVRCDMDVRTGGRYRWVHRSGLGGVVMVGEYLEVERPALLRSTLGLEGSAWPRSEATLRLEEVDGGTVIRASETYPTRRRRERAARDGARPLAAIYERLAAFLAR